MPLTWHCHMCDASEEEETWVTRTKPPIQWATLVSYWSGHDSLEAVLCPDCRSKVMEYIGLQRGNDGT